MQADQERYILEYNYIPKVPSIYSNEGGSINAYLDKWNSGLKMKIGMYLFYIKKQKKIHRGSRIKVVTAEGFVYNATINDTQVVVKIQQDITDYVSNMSALREYFIGVVAINNLRYIIPTFVYTLDYISPYIIYEKIPGKNMHDAIKDGTISTYDEWLYLFYQILISLEIAQRKIEFTHFDLHTGNIMLRPIQGDFSYQVNIDMYTYTINAKYGYIPILIDFGMSSIVNPEDKRGVGAFGLEKYGIVNFMVQGYDMYKLLVYSARDFKDAKRMDIAEKIYNLFNFYEDNDPYSISTKKSDGIKLASKEFCANVTYNSIAAAYTPYELLRWLDIKDNTWLNITDRNTSIIIQEFQKKPEEKCLENYGVIYSYIMYKYIEYYTKLKNPMQYTNQYMIEIDKTLLNKVFKIPIPDMDKMKNAMDTILTIKITNPNPDIKNKVTHNLHKYTSFFEKIKPYMIYYYTIKELNLKEDYSGWLEKFENSEQFKIYTRNIRFYHISTRWGKTLLASKFEYIG